MALTLVDKSAWVRASPDQLEEHGEPCLCAITRLEILYSARSADDYDAQRTLLDSFRDLRMDGATFAAAEGAQRELAARGRHRVALPDLLLAACAQQHAADVLHVDRHFDVLTDVLSFRAIDLRPEHPPA